MAFLSNIRTLIAIIYILFITFTAGGEEHNPQILKIGETTVPLLRPVGTLQIAPHIKMIKGYKAETFVGSPGFNMPIELILTPQGDMYCMALRENRLYKITLEGEKEVYLDNIAFNACAVSADNTLYAYQAINGKVIKITSSGQMQTLYTVDEIDFSPGRKLLLRHDSSIYLVHFSKLLHIDETGQTEVLYDQLPFITNIYESSDRRIILMTERFGFEFSPLTRSLEQKFFIDDTGNTGYNGLTGDEEGNLYSVHGKKIYKINPDYKVSLLGETPDEGLSGIKYLPETQELIGGQHLKGGIIAFNVRTGQSREIIKGNGLVSPIAMAFSINGELAVANDDGANVTLVYPDGTCQLWFHYWSFSPPLSHLLITEQHTIYATESETVNPDKLHLKYVPPEGIITGNLYITTGGAPRGGKFSAPFSGEDITIIYTNGKRETLPGCGGMYIAIGNDGNIYTTGGTEIRKIDIRSKRKEVIATGFTQTGGLAFDIEGNLLVSDIMENTITRISGFKKGTLQGKLFYDPNRYKIRLFRTYPLVVGQLYSIPSNGRYSIRAAPGEYLFQIIDESGKVISSEKKTIK
ncbi:MAG TPA: hypothetical protein P5082_05780 [Treponema sp.]|nr:hypothetical protein [Treponema sp.]